MQHYPLSTPPAMHTCRIARCMRAALPMFSLDTCLLTSVTRRALVYSCCRVVKRSCKLALGRGQVGGTMQAGR